MHLCPVETCLLSSRLAGRMELLTNSADCWQSLACTVHMVGNGTPSKKNARTLAKSGALSYQRTKYYWRLCEQHVWQSFASAAIFSSL